MLLNFITVLIMIYNIKSTKGKSGYMRIAYSNNIISFVLNKIFYHKKH